MSEARCPNVKHFEIVNGMLEVKCRSRFCGHRSGAVVIHVFDPESGELLETKRFKDPSIMKED